MNHDYLNVNGLVDGKIPIGNKCPWLERCQIRDANCPNGINKNVPFSCAAARAWSLCQNPDPKPV